MVITDLFKITNPICISKKLGLYLKNSKNNDSIKYVESLLISEYKQKLEKNKDYKKEIELYLEDNYYKNDKFKIENKNILNFIAKGLNVLKIIPSEDTLIVEDDEYFSEKNKGLKALINPINEYEIEYKILFLFNLLRDTEFKRDEIRVAFYDGYPMWQRDRHNILDNLWMKTYKKRKEHHYIGYQYYKNIAEEYDVKVFALKNFGENLDNFLEGINDYFRLDFIIETLLTANDSDHPTNSILLYSLLIEMLIVNPSNPKENSITDQYKKKIRYFINLKELTDKEIDDFSISLYNIRSRLVHGNYKTLKKELKKFDNAYNTEAYYDFGEFKEENWILSSVAFRLKEIVINILKYTIEDKKKMHDFKFDLI